MPKKASALRAINSFKMSRGQFLLLSFFIAVSAAMAWMGGARGFFSGDDFNNFSFILSVHSEPSAFFARYPWAVPTSFFYINTLLFGPEFSGYILFNVFMHVLNTCLLGALVLRLSKERLAALLAMFFFGLNCQFAEAILWMSGSAHSMMFSFLCAVLILHDLYRATGRPIYRAFSILAGTGGLFINFSGAVVLPLMIASYELCFPRGKKIIRPLLAGTWPYLAGGAAYAAVHFIFGAPSNAATYYRFDPKTLLLFGKNLFDYVDVAYLGIRLIKWELPAVISAGIIFAALWAWLVFKSKGIARFGLLWSAVCMLPYLPVPTVAFFQYSRYRYIPIAGICIYFAVILSSWLVRLPAGKKQTVLKMSFAGVFLVFFALVNMYHAGLERFGYQNFGEKHRVLIEGLRPYAAALKKDGEPVVFVNSTLRNVPREVNQENPLPRPMYVRKGAPWGLAHIDELLNYFELDGRKGYYTVENDLAIIENSLREERYTGIQFTEQGFKYFRFYPKEYPLVMENLKREHPFVRIVRYRKF